MNSSSMRDRITIQSRTVTSDASYGTEIVTWATFASRISAQVQDVLPSKAESSANDVLKAVKPTRIRFRYRVGVTSDMRIVVHGAADRTLHIIAGPAVLGVREWIEVMAEEKSTSGASV